MPELLEVGILCHNFLMKHFFENKQILNDSCIAMNLLCFVIPMCKAADMSAHTYIDTCIHTYTQDNYSNPRCVHARRGLTIHYPLAADICCLHSLHPLITTVVFTIICINAVMTVVASKYD